MKQNLKQGSKQESESVAQQADGVAHRQDEAPFVVNLGSSDLYINRELSHLQFNQRVLEQATDEAHPLLERLKFLFIFGSNMDEFYEIRAANLKKQVDFGREVPGPDGMRPQEVLREINLQVKQAVAHQYAILDNILMPELAAEGITFPQRSEWSSAQSAWACDYFHQEVMPVISPLGLDPAHPFPRLVSKRLNFILSLEGKDAFGRESGLAIVPVPRSLPHLIKVPERLGAGKNCFIFLSSIIHANVDELFPGMRVRECHQFRVIRNADLKMNAAEVEDVALALKGELHSRRFGTAVKLDVADACPEALSHYLLDQFALNEDALFTVDGPVNLQRMARVVDMVGREDLLYAPFSPGIPNALKDENKLFDAIAKDDYLLLHPYQSFTPVVDLLRQAARDPGVLAIKQTLYRTGESSTLVEALAEAARNGKEVTAVIELRARFDEADNLLLASRLQEAGAVVVYGVLGYKSHAKMLLIVRRENSTLKRYVHLGTGNYHPANARIYTDYGLLTSDEVICADVHKVFQQLTGMGKAITPKRLYHAPFTLRKVLIKWIDQEAVAAREGKPARIIAKMNGLTDPKVIRALYRASQAGVTIDLIVRGMCCLRPGVAGVSETIRVVSIVGRFLEHTRAHYFENGSPQVYCSSADWMERNLSKRVEVCFPVMKAKLANRIKGELEAYLADSCQSWALSSDGRYTKVSPGTYDTNEGREDGEVEHATGEHEAGKHEAGEQAEPCHSAQQMLLDKLSITPQAPSETSSAKVC